jgi:hypothetical protein
MERVMLDMHVPPEVRQQLELMRAQHLGLQYFPDACRGLAANAEA